MSTLTLQAALKLATTGFVNPLRQATGELGAFRKSFSLLSQTGNIMAGIQASAQLTRQALKGLGEPIKEAAGQEDVLTQLKVLTGGAKEAKAALDEATDFADATPFDDKPVQQAYKMLLAYGNKQAEVNGLLTDAGDLAAAMGAPLDETVKVLGRLKAGDFGEAFERLRDFGISREDLTGQGLRFDKGGSFLGSAVQAVEGVRQVIRDKFGGMMDEVSRTFNGLWSTMMSKFRALQRELGGPLAEALKPFLKAGINLFSSWKEEAAATGRWLAAGLGRIFEGIRGGTAGADLWAGLKRGATATFNWLKAGWNTLVDGMGRGLYTAWDALQSEHLWDSIDAQFNRMLLNFKANFQKTLSEIAADLSHMLGSIDTSRWMGWAKDLHKSLVGGLKLGSIKLLADAGSTAGRAAQQGTRAGDSMAQWRDSLPRLWEWNMQGFGWNQSGFLQPFINLGALAQNVAADLQRAFRDVVPEEATSAGRRSRRGGGGGLAAGPDGALSSIGMELDDFARKGLNLGVSRLGRMDSPALQYHRQTAEATKTMVGILRVVERRLASNYSVNQTLGWSQ
jgi:hypothetical protein